MKAEGTDVMGQGDDHFSYMVIVGQLTVSTLSGYVINCYSCVDYR